MKKLANEAKKDETDEQREKREEEERKKEEEEEKKKKEEEKRKRKEAKKNEYNDLDIFFTDKEKVFEIDKTIKRIEMSAIEFDWIF